MSFASKVKKMVEEAPVVSSGANVNYGPLVITPMIVKWQGKGNPPEKTPLNEYLEAHGLAPDDDFELGQGESFHMHFDIDVSDLNPALNFHYERDVAVLASRKNEKDPSKDILTDWSEIVEPSLATVFGKNWYDKVLPNGKKAAPILWVAAEQVDSLKPVKDGGKNYGIPRLVAVYKNRDECLAAREERYGKSTGETVPEEGGEVGEYDAELLEQVWQLYSSTRKNTDKTVKLLKNNPFSIEGDFDPSDLLEKAIAANE